MVLFSYFRTLSSRKSLWRFAKSAFTQRLYDSRKCKFTDDRPRDDFHGQVGVSGAVLETAELLLVETTDNSATIQTENIKYFE